MATECDSANVFDESLCNRVELPACIEIKESSIYPGASGAFCKEPIKKDTMFGPYKGEIIKPGDKVDLDYRYAWEVFEKNSNVLKFTISASDDKMSNWMRNVNNARFYEEQNIVSVQEGFSIFYVALKDISPGKELLTYFEPKLLKRTQRRLSRGERRQIGYTIEMVPWSDEKKFVPEIIETKRARKKKVLIDMIGPEEQAYLLNRNINRSLRVDSLAKEVSEPQIAVKKVATADVDNSQYEASTLKVDPASEKSVPIGKKKKKRSIKKQKDQKTVNDVEETTQVLNKPECDVAEEKPLAVMTAENNNETEKIESVQEKQNSDDILKISNVSVNNVVNGNVLLQNSVAMVRKRNRKKKFGENSSKISQLSTGSSVHISKERPSRVRRVGPSHGSPIMKPVMIKREDGTIIMEDHDESYSVQNVQIQQECNENCHCLDKKSAMALSNSSLGDSLLKTCVQGAGNAFVAQFVLLPEHFYRSPTGVLMYQCDICDGYYNHALSLKRHYLTVHINHRYLSRDDIISCQIETFHSGVEVEKEVISVKEEPTSSSGFIPLDTFVEPSCLETSTSGCLSNCEAGEIDRKLLCQENTLEDDSVPTLSQMAKACLDKCRATVKNNTEGLPKENSAVPVRLECDEMLTSELLKPTVSEKEHLQNLLRVQAEKPVTADPDGKENNSFTSSSHSRDKENEVHQMNSEKSCCKNEEVTGLREENASDMSEKIKEEYLEKPPILTRVKSEEDEQSQMDVGDMDRPPVLTCMADQEGHSGQDCLSTDDKVESNETGLQMKSSSINQQCLLKENEITVKTEPDIVCSDEHAISSECVNSSYRNLGNILHDTVMTDNNFTSLNSVTDSNATSFDQPVIDSARDTSSNVTVTGTELSDAKTNTILQVKKEDFSFDQDVGNEVTSETKSEQDGLESDIEHAVISSGGKALNVMDSDKAMAKTNTDRKECHVDKPKEENALCETDVNKNNFESPVEVEEAVIQTMNNLKDMVVTQLSCSLDSSKGKPTSSPENLDEIPSQKDQQKSDKLNSSTVAETYASKSLSDIHEPEAPGACALTSSSNDGTHTFSSNNSTLASSCKDAKLPSSCNAAAQQAQQVIFLTNLVMPLVSPPSGTADSSTATSTVVSLPHRGTSVIVNSGSPTVSSSSVPAQAGLPVVLISQITPTAGVPRAQTLLQNPAVIQNLQNQWNMVNLGPPVVSSVDKTDVIQGGKPASVESCDPKTSLLATTTTRPGCTRSISTITSSITTAKQSLTRSDISPSQPDDLYRCHMCVLLFKTMKELKHHIKNDPHRFKGGVKQYACVQCSLRFRNKNNLIRHNQMNHSSEEDQDRKFRCLTCGKGFTTEIYLKMHERFHLGKSFPCKYGCTETYFPNAAMLVKHLRLVHPGLNLKEYIKNERLKKRQGKSSFPPSSKALSGSKVETAPSYSIHQPGIGFQAKRGRPKGSRNISKFDTDVLEKGRTQEENKPEQLGKLTMEEDKPKIRFRCKRCQRGFATRLRLLQHRTKRHNASQSIPEYLHEMSKDSPHETYSDTESLTMAFSPPPSPKTFFKTVNQKGEENMSSHIDAGIEDLKDWRRFINVEDYVSIRKRDQDASQPVKLEWTQFNFPPCFRYKEDCTVFYKMGHKSMPSMTECPAFSSNASGLSERELVHGKSAKSIHEETCLENDAEKKCVPLCERDCQSGSDDVLKICKDVIDHICSSIDVDEKLIIRSPDGKFKERPGANENNCKLLSCSEEHVSKMSNCECTGAVRSEKTLSLMLEDAQSDQTRECSSELERNPIEKESGLDSGISSLASSASGSLDQTDLSLSYYTAYKQNVDATADGDKNNISNVKSKGLGKLNCFEANLNDVLGRIEENLKEELTDISLYGNKVKRDTISIMSVKGLNLESHDKFSSVHKRKLPPVFYSTLLQALDIPTSVEDFAAKQRMDFYMSTVPQSPTKRNFRLLDSTPRHSLSNTLDSSKHEHRRYSIWSGLSPHKSNSVHTEMSCCPVVEAVRKKQDMDLRRTTAHQKVEDDKSRGIKCSKNEMRKREFAESMGLMCKKDFCQSYHMKKREEYTIKPPEVWKNYDKIWFGKKGTITIVCSICHRHFSCLDLCLRHQLKKHPHIEPASLEMERDNYVEDMFYYYPMPYGILAQTQLLPDNMPPPEVYVCTRCSFPFKNLSKLHSHMIACDPSIEDVSSTSADSQKYAYMKRKALPTMHRRMQQHFITPPPPKRSSSRTTVAPAKVSTLSKVERNSNEQDWKRKTSVKIREPEQKPQRQKMTNFSSPYVFFPGKKHRNYETLYNPQNHTRRREMYQVLDQHQCHGCNLKFNSLPMLERHVNKCSGKEKLRSQKPLLSGILADDAAVRKQHTCRYCNKRFTYIKGVDLHYKRICAVRKVKEEENKLTEDDLAHEAELKRIIEHMKWSKTLNKDSSDIIQGRVRVEEDGTLTRVSKQRGCPQGFKKRVKKKGFKWTTYKRHRTEEDEEEEEEEEVTKDAELKSVTRQSTVNGQKNEAEEDRSKFKENLAIALRSSDGKFSENLKPKTRMSVEKKSTVQGDVGRKRQASISPESSKEPEVKRKRQTDSELSETCSKEKEKKSLNTCSDKVTSDVKSSQEPTLPRKKPKRRPKKFGSRRVKKSAKKSAAVINSKEECEATVLKDTVDKDKGTEAAKNDDEREKVIQVQADKKELIQTDKEVETIEAKRKDSPLKTESGDKVLKSDKKDKTVHEVKEGKAMERDNIDIKNPLTSMKKSEKNPCSLVSPVEAVKPPTRKRGRPQKYDPSDMESSYRKLRKTDPGYIPCRRNSKSKVQEPRKQPRTPGDMDSEKKSESPDSASSDSRGEATSAYLSTRIVEDWADCDPAWKKISVKPSHDKAESDCKKEPDGKEKNSNLPYSTLDTNPIESATSTCQINRKQGGKGGDAELAAEKLEIKNAGSESNIENTQVSEASSSPVNSNSSSVKAKACSNVKVKRKKPNSLTNATRENASLPRSAMETDVTSANSVGKGKITVQAFQGEKIKNEKTETKKPFNEKSKDQESTKQTGANSTKVKLNCENSMDPVKENDTKSVDLMKQSNTHSAELMKHLVQSVETTTQKTTVPPNDVPSSEAGKIETSVNVGGKESTPKTASSLPVEKKKGSQKRKPSSQPKQIKIISPEMLQDTFTVITSMKSGQNIKASGLKVSSSSSSEARLSASESKSCFGKMKISDTKIIRVSPGFLTPKPKQPAVSVQQVSPVHNKKQESSKTDKTTVSEAKQTSQVLSTLVMSSPACTAPSMSDSVQSTATSNKLQTQKCLQKGTGDTQNSISPTTSTVNGQPGQVVSPVTKLNSPHFGSSVTGAFPAIVVQGPDGKLLKPAVGGIPFSSQATDNRSTVTVSSPRLSAPGKLVTVTGTILPNFAQGGLVQAGARVVRLGNILAANAGGVPRQRLNVPNVQQVVRGNTPRIIPAIVTQRPIMLNTSSLPTMQSGAVHLHRPLIRKQAPVALGTKPVGQPLLIQAGSKPSLSIPASGLVSPTLVPTVCSPPPQGKVQLAPQQLIVSLGEGVAGVLSPGTLSQLQMVPLNSASGQRASLNTAPVSQKLTTVSQESVMEVDVVPESAD